MVDFGKKRKEKGTAKPIDPIELFRRLPMTSDINDLWNSQAEALRQWNDKRNDRDVIIKLNTGGGKTLVGLLIGQSIVNETQGSVLYLCPTRQLKKQTFKLSAEYGFNCVMFESGIDLPDDFLTGKSIMIATYSALFNGLTKFGTTESGGDHIPLDGIILDDAHTAFSIIRDAFTFEVDRSAHPELYSELCGMFRNDFLEMNRDGTFDDIISGRDYQALEIPFWSWEQRYSEVRDILSRNTDFRNTYRNFRFVWPLLRDEFQSCHAIFSSKAFSITPLYPIVRKFPSFAECPRRVYISATLADDSSIIRTFNAEFSSVSEPIIPQSLAGVGERMILAPSLMGIEPSLTHDMLKRFVKDVATQYGTLILVPTNRELEKWKDIAYVPESSAYVSKYVHLLQTGKSKGPFAFSNRYDGIDLAGDACRLLVMDGRPKGESSYDLMRRYVLSNSKIVNTPIAQRIEQGAGRGTRGAGDYCVILLLGKRLVSWISKTANLGLLTQSTQKQFKMGEEISRDVKSFEEFEETVLKCFNRDSEWVGYHADYLADASVELTPDFQSLEIASAERNFFRHLRDGFYDKAISELERYSHDNSIDTRTRGWLTQLRARAAYCWGHEQLSDNLQKTAYSLNRKLFRPRIESPYEILATPGQQAEKIVESIEEFKYRRGYLSDFNEIASQLVSSVSSNQFEEGLKNLGKALGFEAERPENDYGEGPDVLWLAENKMGFVIEAKSQKQPASPLRKRDVGQILTSFQWFAENYDDYDAIMVIIHPNNLAYPSSSIANIKALTLDNLSKLVSNVRMLLSDLCKSNVTSERLTTMCSSMLNDLNLTLPQITTTYLERFETVPISRD